jgi:hypothetical protein
MASQEQYGTYGRTESDADERPTQPDGSAVGGDRPVAADDGSLAASDLTVRSGDGRLAALTVSPRVECTWSDLDPTPVEAGATLMVGIDGESGFDPVATELFDLDGFDGRTDGRATLSFDGSYDVVERTGLAAVDFEPPWRGERPRTRTLTLRLAVDLLDEAGTPVGGDVATTECEVVVEGADDPEAD